MRDAWGTDPADLLAAIGPSIGPSDYEVGDFVFAAFNDAGQGDAAVQWFIRRKDGRLTLDLWRANRDQLVSTGVRTERIFLAGLSTATHKGWLESYRRDGPAAGRLVAAIVDAGRGRNVRVPSCSPSGHHSGPFRRFDRRSASLLCSRRTCSKVTRPDPGAERAGLAVQRDQPLVFHLVDPAHLLDQQQRIASDVQLLDAAIDGPAERGEQPAVLRHVVGRDADTLGNLRQHLTVVVDDVDAKARRTWIAAGAPVEIRRNHEAVVGEPAGAGGCGPSPGEGGT